MTNLEKLLQSLEAQHGGTWASTNGMIAEEGRTAAREIRALQRDVEMARPLLALAREALPDTKIDLIFLIDGYLKGRP